ncbi:MAG: NADPH:quinone oxidoreductase family protein [Burkholderiaceae bacterium]
MKAVLVREFAPFEQARVEEVADPVVAAGELLVDVHVAEVNFPDILVMQGQYQVKPPLPFSPGKAGSGVIAAVGDGVRHFAVGQRVGFQVEYGAYAEKISVPAANCFDLPDHVSYIDGAALGLVYQTAYFALVDRAAIERGETVLVLGASGGVGLASVQLAKSLGAGRVIAVSRGADDAEVARQAGADHVLVLGTDELRDGLRAQVAAITEGRGADIVIDPVGGEANAAALRAMAWRGRMVVVGFASGVIPTFKANYLLVKNIAVSGLQWSDYRDREPARVSQVQAEIYALHRAGQLRPLVWRCVPMTQFSDALAELKGARVQGKILLAVRP